MSQVEATLLGVAVATIALSIPFLTYIFSRGMLPLTPSAKLWDRIYELNKLVLSHGDVFAKFMAESQRTAPYFYADPTEVPRDKEFFQLKAIVYFHLDFFDEIFQATSRSAWVANQFERDGWNEYIFFKMRHPLIREVFDKEADRIYVGKFREYIEKNRAKITGSADNNAF